MQKNVQTTPVGDAPATRRPVPLVIDWEKLKPERVQEELMARALQVWSDVRAVQEALVDLPGWNLVMGGRAIRRTHAFPGSRTARAYASYISELAQELGQTCSVAHTARQVTITLYGNARRNRLWLIEPVLGFARFLG
jgi:pterin-4a-carbinolamine dehydratase